jgi:DhnA family fructose-bisphosphate aldolase class Ia
MTLGKALRLRRIFANGRALIVDCGEPAGEPLGMVRIMARAGVDAVVLTPGLLDLVSEELGGLSVILRIDGGMRRAQPLVSVQAALEMGAEAVLLSIAVRGPGPSDVLERFGRVTEDARRLGMPVFAQIAGEDWLDAARLGADYGGDVILARFAPERFADRHLIRTIGRPFVAALEEEAAAGAALLGAIHDLMQGPAQGIVLQQAAVLESPALLEAIHALVHQGVSAEEAAAVAGRD